MNLAGNRYVVDINHHIIGAPGIAGGATNAPGMIPGQTGAMIPTMAGQTGQSVMGAVSAHLLVSGAIQLISASGNTEFTQKASDAAQIFFLGSRIVASGGTDATAWVSLAFKILTKFIKANAETRRELEAMAEKMNALDIMKMRAGLITIEANSDFVRDRYGRATLTTRK